MKNIMILIGFITLLVSFSIEQQTSGEKIFKEKCSSCHTIGKGRLTGPDLKGVNNRRKETWLTEFVKSPRTKIKGGDPIALKLFNEHNRVVMPDPNLTEGQIKEVLNYIKIKSNTLNDTSIIKTVNGNK